MVEYSRMTPEVREQLQKVIADVTPRFDHVLLDTGAGISDVVLYTVSLAGEVLLVATPEPTSLTDAAVREAVQRRQLLMEALPGTPAALALLNAVNRVPAAS